jgi:ABC-type dipeptide/oligopeptide/nickel transport system permease subunit
MPRTLRRPRVARTIPGCLGLVLVAFVVGVALIGPLVAPHAADAPVGVPGTGPSADAPLGTDFLGRDVLSRVLHGGLTVLYLAIAATLLAYLLGSVVGLLAGYLRSVVDPILMRAVDFVLAFPPLIFLLVLLAGAGNSRAILVVGTAFVLFPGVARLVRAATLEASVTGYVEAAVARGERAVAVVGREILPNIVQYVMTDFGLRFSGAVILVASVNFLGLGLQPPTADWGLMISENRVVITANIWAVAAPAIMLGLLTVGVNLIGDAYARTLGRSRARA